MSENAPKIAARLLLASALRQGRKARSEAARSGPASGMSGPFAVACRGARQRAVGVAIMQGSRTRRPDPVHLEPGLQLGNVTGGAERGVCLHRPDNAPAPGHGPSLRRNSAVRSSALADSNGAPPGQAAHTRRPQRHRAQATLAQPCSRARQPARPGQLPGLLADPWSIRSIGLRLSPPPHVRSSGRSRSPCMRAPHGSARAIETISGPPCRSRAHISPSMAQPREGHEDHAYRPRTGGPESRPLQLGAHQLTKTPGNRRGPGVS